MKQTVWGFDGQIVLQRFNVLSLLVDNPAATPFEGTIELRKISMTQQVDAVMVEPVYLAPFSSRWVQFYPYVRSELENWEVTWGKGRGDSYTPLPVRAGKAAAVLLDDPDAIAQSAGAIKRLPDNLFPPFLTATDCLASIILDHAPRWDPARQRSFLQWLNRGGRVYLLRGSDGKHPEFTGDLHVLNGADKLRVGSGYVFRVDRTRRQIDTPFVENIVAPGIEPGTELEEDDATDLASTSAKADPNNPQPTRAFFSYEKWQVEGTLLTHLKQMSNPNHSWRLILFLGLVYLGSIFPGCYLVGQRYAGDYRWTFGFLLGAVVLFSLAFFFIGRRGYGERTAIHSVAVARQLSPGTFDVTQWSNAFVVDGGNYNFTHDGVARIYSSCQDEEKVRGEIRNGADAHFLADMPPFSSRAFSHRALVQADPIEVEVEQMAGMQSLLTENATVLDAARAKPRRDRKLVALALRKGKRFPADGRKMYVLYGRRLYRLRDVGDKLELGNELDRLTNLVHLEDYNEFGSLIHKQWNANFWAAAQKEPTQEEILDAMLYPILARHLEILDGESLEKFLLPANQAKLLIFADLPASVSMKDLRFSPQTGRVLYVVDLFEPELR